MNILNSSEAFAALMAGKNILCRVTGELMDFDDLNQFPATVFAMPGYEYCIKRDFLTLADIKFTKPAEPHDLETGQEIYIVMPTCILRTTYDNEHADIRLSVANGFAQLDEENAKLQLQAFGKTFGNMISEIEVKDGFNDKPKKRTRRTKAEIENSQNSTSNDVEEKSFQSQPDAQAEIPVTYVEAEEPVDTIAQLKKMQLEAEALVNDPAAANLNAADQEIVEFALEQKQVHRFQVALDEILEKAKTASTPAQANALYKYTATWTEAERAPVINAVHARLAELNQQNSEPQNPPSLMVRIQNAPDLAELAILEIEVSERDPEIQPKLMGYIKARRFELQNQGSEVAS